MMKRLALAFLVAVSAAAIGSAHAAELTVFATGSMAEPFRSLSEEYAKKTGDTFQFAFGTTKMVMDRLTAGGKPDIIAISSEAGDKLEKDGTFAKGTRVDIARAVFGVAVKDGAPAPDISSVNAFKTMLLKAKSISYPDAKGGAVTGIYLEKLFRQFGIADAMKMKSVPKPVGADVARAIANGEVEIGLTFVSEFVPVKGVKVVGPFPDSIQDAQLYTAAVTSSSAHADAARAFLAFVTSRESAAKLKAMGVQPVAR